MQAKKKSKKGDKSTINPMTPTKSRGKALPEGWVEKMSKSSGKKYYYNAESNTTSWEFPEEPSSEEEAPKRSASKSKSSSSKKSKGRDDESEDEEKGRKSRGVGRE